MDCSVCCEKTNKTTRKAVNCPYCAYVCCYTCFKTYLMDPNKNGADCMSCHKELSLEFIAETTTHSFHNQVYRNKRATDLLSQERSLLPDTQHLVEDRQRQKAHDKQIAELHEEEEYLKLRLREIKTEINYHRYGWRRDANGESKEDPTKERKKFIMACPVEDCRGFLSTAWKCGTCEVYVCPDCRIVKGSRNDEEHKCDENLVASVKMIAAETKNCPQCAVPIYKIDGCSQMWCVECHTPFSWTTGERVTGVIHNPHYYQWQRDRNGGQAPRVPGDVPYNACGGLPTTTRIVDEMAKRGQFFQGVYNCHRLVEHMRWVVLPRYPDRIGIQDNSDLRVQYLLNEISEEKWQQVLKERQKKSEKNRAIHQVLDMFINTMTDVFNNYITNADMNIEREADALRNYVNRELAKIKKRYANNTPHITPQWVCW